MLKRLLLIVALGAALAACSSGSGSSGGVDSSIAPIESMPAESAPAS